MSFSAEMKDFIGSWEKGNKILGATTDDEYNRAKTDSLKQKTARENDPAQLALQDEQARATLARTKAGTGLIGEQMKNAGVSRAYTGALTDRLRQQPDIGGYPTGNLPPQMGVGDTGPAPATAGAPGLQPREDLMQYEEGGAIPDDRGASVLRQRMQENDRTRDKAWRGDQQEMGMSRAARTEDDLEADRKGVSRERNGRIFYADGGAIPDQAEPEPDEDDSVGPGALPQNAQGERATDFSSRGRRGGGSGLPQGQQGGYQGIISPKLVSDAVLGAYRYPQQAMGFGRGTGARSRAAAQAIAQGQDALSPQEMDAARKAVDPQGKLTDSQRNMAALGSVYQYWANKGDPARADKVAFQMLQHFRLASQRYAAIAAAATEHGNMDLATTAALKAYSNVPDGRDMQVTQGPDGKLQYTYTDENGKTLRKGVATPQEFAAAAMGLTKGGFDQLIMSSAAAREQGQGKGKATAGAGKTGAPAVGDGANEDKVSDAAKRGEGLDAEIAKMQEQAKSKKDDPNYWGGLRDSATHLMQQNPNMTAREAMATAQALVDPKRGGSDNFRVSDAGPDGMSTIQFKDGARVKVTEEMLDRMTNERAAARRTAQTEEDQAKAEAAKPSRLKAGMDYIAQGVSNDARKFGNEVSGMIPDELKARGKSAIDAAGRAAEDYVAKPAREVAGAIGSGSQPDLNYGSLTTAIGEGVKTAIDALRRGGAGSGAIPSNVEEQQP